MKNIRKLTRNNVIEELTMEYKKTHHGISMKKVTNLVKSTI